MTNIVRKIKETKKYLKHNAVIQGDRAITYAQLLEAVEDLSRELMRRGVSRFDRVALLCDERSRIYRD